VGGAAVRRLTFISIDLLLVAAATVIAVMLRGYFDSVSASLVILMPYVFISVSCASFVFLVAGLDRTPWRYSTVADYFQIIVLTTLAILLALVFTFALNRLEPVARSLPVLQGGLIVSVLICARSATRFRHARRIDTNGDGRANEQLHETILVVGLNTVTELFLMSVKEFAYPKVQVVGLLVEEPEMRGRAIRQTPILGTVEELPDILQSLEVHGVAVNRIVVATAANGLQPGSLKSLFEVEKSSDIVLQFLPERLGFEDVSENPSSLSGREPQTAIVRLENVIDLHHAHSTTKLFLLGKRLVDIFGAVLLIFTLAPVGVLVAFIVGLDVGFPVIFWQQRPGLYGRPFKLYKFRTMRAPHDRHKQRIPDDQRSSAIGLLLRRIRLDELPQLYNVLVGNMSLIGPRPLLLRDQPPQYAGRLSMRPGITGWAQVNGGRIISASEKWMLDVWYVNNASLLLDLKIFASTIKMIFLGDRINSEAVGQARNDFDSKTLASQIVPAE
jgi:lipopolysaccharide/colanic/teichoic acid biosynthesis glycosyltransferase